MNKMPILFVFNCMDVFLFTLWTMNVERQLLYVLLNVAKGVSQGRELVREGSESGKGVSQGRE